MCLCGTVCTCVWWVESVHSNITCTECMELGNSQVLKYRVVTWLNNDYTFAACSCDIITCQWYTHCSTHSVTTQQHWSVMQSELSKQGIHECTKRRLGGADFSVQLNLKPGTWFSCTDTLINWTWNISRPLESHLSKHSQLVKEQGFFSFFPWIWMCDTSELGLDD